MLLLPAVSHATTRTIPSRGTFGTRTTPGDAASQTRVRVPKRRLRRAGSLTRIRSGYRWRIRTFGSRVSEVNGLRVGDVTLGAAPVAHLHGKGRKERIVPLWKSTAAIVRRWLPHLPSKAEADYLFPSQEGGRLSRSSIAQRLALAIKTAAIRLPQLAGRPISPHTIRHTTAMHLLQSGVDITVIALWLGHEDPSTTNIFLEADLEVE